jgi:hypothetical protein
LGAADCVLAAGGVVVSTGLALAGDGDAVGVLGVQQDVVGVLQHGEEYVAVGVQQHGVLTARPYPYP